MSKYRVEKIGYSAKKKTCLSDSNQNGIKGLLLKSCFKTEVVEIKENKPSGEPRQGIQKHTQFKVVNLIHVICHNEKTPLQVLGKTTFKAPSPPMCHNPLASCVLGLCHGPMSASSLLCVSG